MLVTADLLKRFPILSVLPNSKLEELKKASTVKKFNRRAVVLAASKTEETVCFLFEGRLQGVDFTIDGREVGLYFVEPGEIFGELALFDASPQPEHVIALTSAVVVSVPAAKLKRVVKEQAEISNLLSAKLASRIKGMTFQRSLLGLPNIAQRVCCQLWSLLPSRDKENVSEGEIQNPPTHMEIAIMLNVSRETVSRVFQALQNEEIVRRDGNTRLRIIKIKSLQGLAEGTRDI
jgi:CRP-like cAMP-binding protein